MNANTSAISGISAGGAYSLLSSKEQWDLHNFYLVTQDVTDSELRLHRQVVKQVDPSLPQRAGRAYAKLKQGNWKQVDYAVTSKGHAIVVRSVVKPKPDLYKLSRAVIALQRSRESDPGIQ